MGIVKMTSLVCQDKRTYQTEDQTNSLYYSDSLKNRPPRPLSTLPSLAFTDLSHFSINRTIFTRTAFREDDDVVPVWSSLLISDPFTSGVISGTITILSLTDLWRDVLFGLMDFNDPIPVFDERLGVHVKNSVALDQLGTLWFNTPSSHSYEACHFSLNEFDCVRMEVDLDSTPRTVQFFVNGQAGECYMSGIPSSVRIGFTVWGPETSFRIDKISRLSRPTPFSEGMMESLYDIKKGKQDEEPRNYTEKWKYTNRMTPTRFCGLSSDVGNALIAGADEQAL
ncbi:hypothetical protein BLNAU_7703 [Blattamonas nauphoetae]|uniref:Uncharacterized protein n=1 Tax=Blattamonas nauphoetae TaxID=2049346 RepID=A0ABQ9Y0S0_9EUKA|nr:hypothetical protein BLNAU_7703 [Blattamonas nauphoetae]